jgi:AAA domain
VPTIPDEPRGVNPALVDALERAIWQREARRRPHHEVVFRCALPGHEDVHPSCRWNGRKATFYCDVCGKGGGALELAALLNVDASTEFAIKNTTGDIVAIHERHGDGPAKRMRWRRADGELGLGGMSLATLPLYGSEALAQLEPGARVVLVEGEKCADHLIRHGIPAVASVTGSGGTPSDDSLRVLAGFDVLLWTDADGCGRQHMQRIAARLTTLGITQRIVDPWPALSTGKDAADCTGEEIAAVLAAMAPAPTFETELQALGFVSGDAFLLEPDQQVEWVVDGLLPAGGLSLLAAKPKAGKSTLARAAAVAVSQGAVFLGRSTVAGPVAYITSEGQRDDHRRHFRRLGVDRRVFIHVGPPEWTDPVAWIRRSVDLMGCRLVVLDPLARFTQIDDLNDYAKVTRATGPLIALAQETECHFLWVHHAGKGERVAIDASLGSTALAGFVDTIMLLRRHGDGLRTLETIQRTGDDLSETVVRLYPHTGALTLAGTVEFQQTRAAIPLILEVLADKSLSEEEIREQVVGSNTIVAKALREALSAGDVLRSGGGVKGNPYRYRLPTTPPDEERERINPPPSAVQAGKRAIRECENGGGPGGDSTFSHSRIPASLSPEDPPPPKACSTQVNACSKREDAEPAPEKPRRRRVPL